MKSFLFNYLKNKDIQKTCAGYETYFILLLNFHLEHF